MYYVVSEQSERILEALTSKPDPQERADKFDCVIFIIEGQEIGLCAEPSHWTEGEIGQPIMDNAQRHSGSTPAEHQTILKCTVCGDGDSVEP